MVENNLFISFIRQGFPAAQLDADHELSVVCCIKTLSDANICFNQDRTISGKLCQKWNEDFPHVTKLSTVSNVLKKTGSLDHNKCVHGLVANDPRIGCMMDITIGDVISICVHVYVFYNCDPSKTIMLHN